MNGEVQEFQAMRPPKALVFEDSLIILGKLLSDPGCDIMLGQKITMKDSISMKQFTHPCRAFGCKHVQCFDFEVYLHVNRSKLSSEYCCPICQQISNPSKIYVDSVFLCLLQILPDDSTVNLMKDGTFEVTLSTRNDIEIINVDDDEEDEFEESIFKSNVPILGTVAELTYIMPFTAAKSKKNHTTLKQLAEASLDDVLYLINVDNAWGVNTIPDISALLQKYIKNKRPYACTTVDGLLFCLRQVDGMGEVRAGRIVNHLFGLLQKKLTGFLEHIKSRSIASSGNSSLSSPVVVEFLKKKGKLRSVAPLTPAIQAIALEPACQNTRDAMVRINQSDRSNSDREGTATSSGSSDDGPAAVNGLSSAAKARANSIISVDSSVCEDSHHSVNTPSSTTYTTTDSTAASSTTSAVSMEKRSPRSGYSVDSSTNGNTSSPHFAFTTHANTNKGQPSTAAHRAKGSTAICGEGIADVAGLPKLTRLGRNNSSSGTIFVENSVAPEFVANNPAYTLQPATVTDLCESSGSEVEASARRREQVVLAASPKQRSPRSRVASPTASVRSATSAEGGLSVSSPSTRRSKRTRTAEEPVSPSAENPHATTEPVHALRSRAVVDVGEAQDTISVSSASAIVPITSPSRFKRARREAQRLEEVRNGENDLRDYSNCSVVSDITPSGSSAASSVTGGPVGTFAPAPSQSREAQTVQPRTGTVVPSVTDRIFPPEPPFIPSVPNYVSAAASSTSVASPQASRRSNSQNIVSSPSGTHIRFQNSPESDPNPTHATSSAAINSTAISHSRKGSVAVDVKPFIGGNRVNTASNSQKPSNSMSATALVAPNLHTTVTHSSVSQQQQIQSLPARPPQTPVVVVNASRSKAANEVISAGVSDRQSSVSTTPFASSRIAPTSQQATADKILSPTAKSRDYAQEDSQKFFNPRLNIHPDQHNQPVIVPAYHYGFVNKPYKDQANVNTAPPQAAVKIFYPRGGVTILQNNPSSAEDMLSQAHSDACFRGTGTQQVGETKWTSAAPHGDQDFARSYPEKVFEKKRPMESDKSRSPRSQPGRHNNVSPSYRQDVFQEPWSATRSPQRRDRSRSRERNRRDNETDSDRARRRVNQYYNNSNNSDNGSRNGLERSLGDSRSDSRDRGNYQGRDSHSRDTSRAVSHYLNDGGANGGPYIDRSYAVGWKSEMASASDSSFGRAPFHDSRESERDYWGRYREQDRMSDRSKDVAPHPRDKMAYFPSQAAPAPPIPPPPPFIPESSVPASSSAPLRLPQSTQIGSRGYNMAPTVTPSFPHYNANRSTGMVRQSAGAPPPPVPNTLARTGATASVATVPSAPSSAMTNAPQPTPSGPTRSAAAAIPPAPLAPATMTTADAPKAPSSGRTTAWKPPEPKLPPPKSISTAGSSSDASSKHTANSAGSSTTSKVGLSNNNTNTSSTAAATLSSSNKATRGIVRVYEGKVVPMPAAPQPQQQQPQQQERVRLPPSARFEDKSELSRAVGSKASAQSSPRSALPAPAEASDGATAAARQSHIRFDNPLPSHNTATTNTASKKKASNNAKLLDAPPTPVGAEKVSASSQAQEKYYNTSHFNYHNDRRSMPPKLMITATTASTGYHAAVGNINNRPSNYPAAGNNNNGNKNNRTEDSFTSLIVQNFSGAPE